MSPATTASADGIWKNVECSVSPCPTETVRTRCPSSSNSGSASALGTTGASGSSPGQPGRPVLGGLVHLCFPRGAGGYFRGCEAARLGKVFEKSPETEPVVRVPVGDVDASDALAETLGPLCQGVCLTVGHQGVNKDRLILAGDQGAAHRGPGRVVAGPLGWVACVGADRGDEDVD